MRDNGSCTSYKTFHPSPFVIYCDDKSTLDITANHVFHERTKHIEINYHVVGDKVQAEIMHFLPIASKDRVAEIMTKSLHVGPLKNLQRKL